MSKYSPKESQFQAAAMEYLAFVLQPPAFAFHVANEGKRSKWTGAELKRQGMLPGAADIIILYPEGRALGLELKSAKGTMTLDQKLFQEKAARCGVPVTMVRTIEEIDKALAEVSVPVRATNTNQQQKRAS